MHIPTIVEETSTLREGISVVVPVYYSEASLTPLVDRLHEVLPRLAGEWEIILVDDGSHE